jgi:uncharacterized membrane protein YvlD (DUF360 family)
MFALALHVAALTAVVLVVARVLPGVRLHPPVAAIGVALVYALLNVTLAWVSALASLLVPRLVALALFGVGVNAVLVWVTDRLVPWFSVVSMRSVFLMAALVTAGNLAIASLL